MPTTAQHKKKAEDNEFFVANLDNPFWDWAVVGVFYSALQYVEAYFANLAPPLHPATHTIRDSHINRDTALNPIYVDYRELSDESRDARYDPTVTFTQADVQRLQRNLNRIKAVIVPTLP